MAILDLDGEVVKLKSSRNFSLRNIVRFLSRECNPVLIASDVNPAPRLAEKVSTSFSVPLHTPHESLSRKAKSRLVRDFNLRGLARHKKDALAAAVSAFGSLAPMIRKVGERISGAGLSGDVSSNDVAGKIILGKYRNIETAIRELVQERGNPKALKKGNAQRARTRHSRDGYGTDW